MADLNIYYHKQTNSWWINKEMDGFTFKNYVIENPVGLGRIEMNTNNKLEITDLYEIDSAFIPSHIKKLNGITEEIEENGLENAVKVSDKELKDLLK
jgi:hypothetical protein